MATTEVEQRIRQLDPIYLQELTRYLDYLLFVQKKQRGKNGKSRAHPAKTTEAVGQQEENIPERLRIARQYFNTAPKPHFPVTKYDFYEQ